MDIQNSLYRSSHVVNEPSLNATPIPSSSDDITLTNVDQPSGKILSSPVLNPEDLNRNVVDQPNQILSSQKSIVKVNALMNKKNGILWELPPGKPDSNQPLIDPLNDQRKRVYQSGQKGNTCWYYALKCLRTNYGKNCKTFKVERELEKTISEYRKKLSFIDDVVGMILHCKKGKLPDNYKIETFNEAKKMLGKVPKTDLINNSTFLNNIKSQKESLIYNVSQDFFKKRFNISAENYLNKCKFTDLDTKNEVVQQVAISEIPQSTWSPLLKIKLLQSYVKEMGFKTCAWNPKKSIDLLIKELKLHGPLESKGRLGLEYFNTKPMESKNKIGERSIWYWSPGSYDPDQDHLTEHCIVIVGAEKNLNNGYVYFLDPMDPSDHANRETKRIYKISYERFLSGVIPTWDYLEPDEYLLYNSKLPNFTPAT